MMMMKIKQLKAINSNLLEILWEFFKFHLNRIQFQDLVSLLKTMIVIDKVIFEFFISHFYKVHH